MTNSRRHSSNSTSSEEDNTLTAAHPITPPQAQDPDPSIDDREAWKAHWIAQRQPWRTEPEISKERKKELEEHRVIVPNVEKGIYPFKQMKLNRADIEWLLATHEGGYGPIYWNDEKQRGRQGLDLRGANLCQVDLGRLPLARIIGGLHWSEWQSANAEQREAASIHLEHANLRGAHLEGARLRGAHLEHAQLRYTLLEDAQLLAAYLQGTDFFKAHLEGATLREAHLARANFRFAYFDQVTSLDYAILQERNYGPVFLADAHLSTVNLAVIDWEQISMLGDEYEARQKYQNGEEKPFPLRIDEYSRAIRANRQLASIIQSQGLNDHAARFTYRAQVLQRRLLWLQLTQADLKFKARRRMLGSWLFSWFLFVIAGYGYQPGRSFLAYLFIISGFAALYYLVGHLLGPSLSPLGAFVFSMTSFHGRGFFPGNNIALDDPLTVLAALEALVGLIIEVTFIATLTQRFFNR